MKRMFAFGLGVMLLSGCGTVSGIRLTSIEPPCFGFNPSEQTLVAPPVETVPPAEPEQIAPSPPKASELPSGEEELPPPPPVDFEVTSGLQKTTRRPILIPIQQTAVRVSNEIATKLK